MISDTGVDNGSPPPTTFHVKSLSVTIPTWSPFSVVRMALAFSVSIKCAASWTLAFTSMLMTGGGHEIPQLFFWVFRLR